MDSKIVTHLAFGALIVVAAFNALSAVGGAIGMLFTDGLGMPLSLLEASVFTSFLWPALLLLVVIGGVHVIATLLLLGRRISALVWSAVAGFSMLVWIFVEIILIRGSSWIQGLYFSTGVIELVLVLLLLGILPWLPPMTWALTPARSHKTRF